MSSQESVCENYKRLQRLLDGHGRDTLHRIFRTRYLLLTTTGWQDGSKVSKEFLRPLMGSETIRPEQCQVMETADINNFDLELLTNLIPKLDRGRFLTPQFSMVSNQLRPETVYVEELEDLRIRFTQLSGKTVDGKQFEELLDDLEEVLYKLGVSKEYFDEPSKAFNFHETDPESCDETEEDSLEAARNYLRLQKLLNDEGGELLREIFQTRYLMMTNKFWEDGSEEGKRFLQSFLNSNPEKILPSQVQAMEAAGIDNFSNSFLIALIRSMDILPCHSVVKEEVRYENLKIRQLGVFLDKFAGLPEKELGKRNFECLWGRARRILIKLGVDEKRIEEIRKDSSKKTQEDESLQRALAEVVNLEPAGSSEDQE